ncbi:MAG: PD-(D/E)XK nuclease family protein [Clostridia bacterium]|nr:PD-(D/E)XK nuclease family protein [Clostridia bacterium]
MNGFLQELTAWLTEYRFEQKVLLARNVTAGNQLLRMAADAGCPAVNVLVMTVSDLLGQLSEPVLRAGGLRRVDRITAVMTLRECMRSFGDRFVTAGGIELATAVSVLNLLDELEGNCVDPRQLRDRGEAVLADLWIRYTRARSDLGFASLSDIMQAVRVPDHIRVAVLSDLHLTEFQSGFIRSIPPERVTFIHMKTPGGEPVPRDMPFQTSAAEEPVSAWPECVSCQDIGTEILGAFQYLAEHDIPAEDAVFVCPDSDYGLRAEEEGRLLGIGVSSAFGKPASVTRSAELLRCIQAWGANFYDAECLTPVLTEGGMALNDPEGRHIMVGQELLRIFRVNAVGWGSERWEKLSRSEDERCRQAGEMMYEWVSLFESGAQPARQIAARLISVLRRCIARGPENDLYYNTIDEISRLYSDRITAADYISLVQDVADAQIVEARRTDEPGRVYCCGYENAVWVNRKHFIMLGMSWDAFDRLTPEFALLHDDAKAALSPMLRLAGDNALGRRWAVRELLANRPEAHVRFSYVRADHTGGTDILASSLIDDAAAAHGGAEYIPQVNILGRQPLTEQDLRLAGGLSARHEPGALPDTADADWRAYIAGMRHSSTKLEKALVCPRSFVFRYVLHMEAEKPEPLDPTADTWLDALTRGTLAHSVLCSYFRAAGSVKGEPDLKLLFSLLDREIAAAKEKLPVPVYLSDITAETDRLRVSLIHTAEMYAADPGRTVTDTEISFGRDDDCPVILTFGPHSIRFDGVIDRVDETPEGVEIIDYKTGKPQNFRKNLDHHLQYYLYTLAWEQLHPDKPVKRACYYLIDADTAVDTVSFEMDAETRDAMYARMRALLDVLSDHDLAFRPGYESDPPMTESARDERHPDCTFCDYKDICDHYDP